MDLSSYTCENAAVPDSLTSSCYGVVFYQAARRYANFSQDYALDDYSTMETEATLLINYLATSQAVGNQRCFSAAKTYACMKAFPYCPYSSGGVSYLPSCQDACELVKSRCTTSGAQNLKCSDKPNFGGHCFSIPSDGYFLLPDDQGSYGLLPGFYVFYLCVWIILCASWWRKVCNDPNSTKLHMVLLVVPASKVILLLTSAIFWLTCAAWSLCGFWSGVILTNAQMVNETLYFFAFMCIASGWCVAYENISNDSWRKILIRSCTFYMCESMLLVFKDYIGILFWFLTAILYSTYIYIAFDIASKNVATILLQLRQAEDEHLNVIATLLVRKLKVLRLFQFTLLLYLFLEVSRLSGI